MEEKMTYESAYEELKAITNDIEEENVSVDILATKVKRAAELLKYCQDKLRSTEEEVNKIIKQMDSRDVPE